MEPKISSPCSPCPVGWMKRDIDECIEELKHRNSIIQEGRAELSTVRARLDLALAALRGVLPMAEAWARRAFGSRCDHGPGECSCDAEARARESIRAAISVLAPQRKDR